MPRKRKKKKHCEGCGEDGKIQPLVIQVNGKKVGRWDLCQGCIMVKSVAVHDHRRNHG